MWRSTDHAKQGIAYNYKGQRSGRPHLATWAEAGLVLAADLLAGDEDPRAGVVSLLGRALAGLAAAAQPHGGHGRVRVRGDIGYFTKDLAQAVVTAGADFAIGANRNPATWRAAATVPEDGWVEADGMPGAQVAVADYAPGGWPAGTRCLIRRVRHAAATVSADPRARRRKTIPADQLTLALDGDVDHVWAYSFIVTNLDISTPVCPSLWFRRCRSRRAVDRRTGGRGCCRSRGDGVGSRVSGWFGGDGRGLSTILVRVDRQTVGTG